MARTTAWALAAAAVATTGCCTTLTRGAAAGLRRDTPEEAVEALRRAFVEEDLGAQYDALHPDFTAREGISEFKYRMAHDRYPEVFRRAAETLAAAGAPALEPGDAPVETSAGPRPWVRVRLATAGGSGVFVLVDDPGYLLVTDDGDVPEKPGSLAAMDRAARVEGGHLVLDARIPLGTVAPRDGAEVRRVELRHRWLLWSIETLEGFDDLVREAATAARDSGKGDER